MPNEVIFISRLVSEGFVDNGVGKSQCVRGNHKADWRMWEPSAGLPTVHSLF